MIIFNENSPFGNHQTEPEALPGHAPGPWEFLHRAARELGFVAAGVVPSEPVPTAARTAYLDWLERGLGAAMGYLSRHPSQRFDPRHPRMLDRSTALVSVALPYGIGSIRTGLWRLVAAHARGRDYHAVLRERLATLARQIAVRFPGCEWRVFVDTAPLLERAWALAAGLGVQGRHGGVIVPGVGARVLLGEILCSGAPAPAPATAPRSVDPCADCTRCVDACPAGAIVDRAVVDARRCLSYHTIEQRHEPLDQWVAGKLELIFGCDTCTKVCPLERTDPICALDPPPNPGPRSLPLDRLVELDDAELAPLLADTCLARGGSELIKRNARALLDATR